jgi:glyceraldehyde 3-phosphate dehydrogenase
VDASREFDGEKLRVGICGLGRIGRSILRAWSTAAAVGHPWPGVEIVATCDPGEAGQLAYLVERDSFRGTVAPVRSSGTSLSILGRSIHHWSAREIPPWRDLSVDVVVECTGLRTSRDLATAHLEGGASCVIVSAPCAGADRTIVFGYNHELLVGDEVVISAASCTAHCVVPMVAALQKSVTVDSGMLSTVHSYTADQRLVDSVHDDRRRSRAAAINIIPGETESAALSSRILGMSIVLGGRTFRVPVPNAAAVDLVLSVGESVTASQIVDLYRDFSTSHNHVAVSFDPLVSTDIIGRPESCIIDAPLTLTVGRLVKVIAWYDNEWAYANRMLDTLQYLWTLVGLRRPDGRALASS